MPISRCSSSNSFLLVVVVHVVVVHAVVVHVGVEVVGSSTEKQELVVEQLQLEV